MSDLTTVFREAYRECGGSPPPILRPIGKPKTEFTSKAKALWAQLVELQKWLKVIRVDYLDVRRHSSLTDDEREQADKHADTRIKQAMKSIDQLRSLASNSTSSGNSGEKGHRLGVLLLLSNAVQKLQTQHKNIRDFRLRESIARKELSVFNVNTGSANNRRRQEHADNDSEDVEKLDGVDRFDETQLPPGELAQLQEENALLFNELNSLVSEVRETEKRVLEISRLEAILETQVAKQSKEIETLYDEAVTTTERVGAGNEVLQKAKQSSSNFRRYMLLFIIFLSMCLLFLDWYSSRS